MKRPQKKFVLVPAEDYLYDVSSEEDDEIEDNNKNFGFKRRNKKRKDRSKRWDDEAAEYLDDDEPSSIASKVRYLVIVSLIVGVMYLFTHPEIKIGDREIGSVMPQSMLSVIKDGREYFKSKFVIENEGGAKLDDKEDEKKEDDEGDEKENEEVDSIVKEEEDPSETEAKNEKFINISENN